MRHNKRLLFTIPLTILVLLLSNCVSQSGKYSSSSLNGNLKGMSVESFNLTDIKNCENKKITSYILPQLPHQTVYSEQFKELSNSEITNLLLPNENIKDNYTFSINKNIIKQNKPRQLVRLKEPSYTSLLKSRSRKKKFFAPSHSDSASNREKSSTASSTSKRESKKIKTTLSKSSNDDNKNSNSKVKEPQVSPEREIFAKINDRVEISYEGSGWIYTGFNREDNKNISSSSEKGRAGDKAVVFLNKKITKDNKSIFVFKPQQLGIYILKFVNQNNETGNSIYKYVRLKVVSDKDFEKILSSNENTSSNANETTSSQSSNIVSGNSNANLISKEKKNENYKTLKTADYFFKNGDYTNALHLYLKNYTPEDRYLNDRIAQIYFFKRNYDVAEKYWKRNLETGTQNRDIYYCRAIIGIMEVAAATNDIITLVEYMDNFTHLGDYLNAQKCDVDNYENAYCFVIKNLTEHKRYDIALQMGKIFLDNFPESPYLDELYYYMGIIYENSKTHRDLEQALIYYRKIYNNYPASKFYIKAKRRINYIMQHFFYVR